jgi:sugar transferase (PEP-CTERM/EpsH1 system associated)
MSLKPEILYIAHRIPYPPNKGDKIRSFNEIKYLSKKFTIDLVCLADDPADMKFAGQLKKYCRRVVVFRLKHIIGKIKGLFSLLKGKSISEGYFFHLGMAVTIERWLAKYPYKAILCFSSPMAVYLDSTRVNKSRKIRCIMDFCDLDSDKWLQYARKRGGLPGLIYRLESYRLFKFEKKINQSFDSSVFVSQKEQLLFKNAYPKARNLVTIRNGVDVDFFSPGPDDGLEDPPKKGPVLMFAGVMDYYANVDGVLWFCQRIFPLIKKQIPDVCLVIAGSRPVSSIQKLNNRDDIRVTGYVRDIRPWYARADVCIVPLRIARGVQNKVLEAMAMAKPMVSTPEALQGICCLSGHHLVSADTPGAFAQAVVDVLKNPDHARKLSQSARKFVQKEYDWARCLNPLERLIL